VSLQLEESDEDDLPLGPSDRQLQQLPPATEPPPNALDTTFGELDDDRQSRFLKAVRALRMVT
jgi:hypothetical protein